MNDTLPYGTWPSPLTPDLVSAATVRLDGARFVADDVWWGETVAEEGGRSAVRRAEASDSHPGQEPVVDVLPAPWSARSRVHEYGGGSWTATDDGVLLFVEKTDQRVWMLRPDDAPVALTPADAGMRFGGLTWRAGRLLAVRETHGLDRPRRDIVEIGLDGTLTELVDDSDFVAHPALSPDGSRLAWIAWNHPDMAWDRAQLRVGRLDDGRVAGWSTVAGGSSSPLQPTWVGDDELICADDVTGRWNLFRLNVSDLQRHPVAAADADTGGPLWVLGTRWYHVLDDGRVVAIRTNGSDEIVVIDPAADSITPLPLPVCAFANIEDARGTEVLISGSGVNTPPGLWRVDIDDPSSATLVRGGTQQWGPEWMPRARPVTYDGPQGPVHAFAYPPTNPDVTAPEDELPPYVVFVHGGPTTHVGGATAPRFAAFTSRGIGVLDVNYGGSSGYGRHYRERLRGQWGVVDVADVAAAARGLAAEGRADPARIAIAGGSAGGWTVLGALVDTDVFAAGISRYGVGDARALAADTHDFEARYLDGLIGPLPDAEPLYLARSPLSRADRFRVPVLLLQGSDDEVVPPSQSEAIRDALAANGVRHAYVLYAGEGHGFRAKETVVDAQEKELAFLGAVFGFEVPGIPPLELS